MRICSRYGHLCRAAISRPPGAPIVDITFVDDDAFFIVAKNASDLDRNIEITAQTLLKVFKMFGLTINFAKGKTELIISYRGREAKLYKHKLAESAKHALPGLKDQLVFSVAVHGLDGLQNINICVVDRYKHLGSVVSACGSLVPEAQRRARSAMASFAKLSTPNFANAHIDLKRRIDLAWSLVFSNLFYNVHTWYSFRGPRRDILNKVY